LRIRQQRLIALQVPLHLAQRGLVAARIDLGQQLARLDLLALFEMQRRQLAADLGPHHRRGACTHGANGLDHYAHILAPHHAHRHRLHLPASTEAPRPARARR